MSHVTNGCSTKLPGASRQRSAAGKSILGLLAALPVTALLLGADKPDTPQEKHHEFPMVQPPAEFDRMAGLVGDWEGRHESSDGHEYEVAVEYRLTSGGTVLVEKLNPGGPHEMFTMYHGHDGRMMLTHYCALGNQPRMQMQENDDPKVFQFTFLDATSMSSATDSHMHGVTVTLLDKDRLQHEWVFFEGGKQKSVEKFEFTRKK